MQETKGLRIKIDRLPLRPKKLNPDELRAVFGGCDGGGAVCADNNSCCPFLKCKGGVDSVQPDGSIREVIPNRCR